MAVVGIRDPPVAACLGRGGGFALIYSAVVDHDDGFLADWIPALAVFQTAYVVLTIALLSGGWARIRRWAEGVPEPTWLQRFVYLTRPGAGLAVWVSVVSLAAVSLLILRPGGHVSRLTVAGSVLLVVMSWATLLLGFALDYLLTDAPSAWRELEFPGREGPGGGSAADYVYFATSVSTSFGATDVNVLGRRARRSVIAHSITAFAFNTVILALTISAVMALRG